MIISNTYLLIVLKEKIWKNTYLFLSNYVRKNFNLQPSFELQYPTCIANMIMARTNACQYDPGLIFIKIFRLIHLQKQKFNGLQLLIQTGPASFLPVLGLRKLLAFLLNWQAQKVPCLDSENAYDQSQLPSARRCQYFLQ